MVEDDVFLSKEFAEAADLCKDIGSTLRAWFYVPRNLVQQRIRTIKIDFILAILTHGRHRANVVHVDEGNNGRHAFLRMPAAWIVIAVAKKKSECTPSHNDASSSRVTPSNTPVAG